MTIKLLNNFLFLVPVLIWNLVFASRLPLDKLPQFSSPVPGWLTGTENVFRVLFMLYPFLLPIDTKHALFRPGLIVFGAGLILYFALWVFLMLAPDTAMAVNPVIEFAPAYTPIIWAAGIAMMSRSVILSVVSVLFVGFHVAEYLVRYSR